MRSTYSIAIILQYACSEAADATLFWKYIKPMNLINDSGLQNYTYSCTIMLLFFMFKHTVALLNRTPLSLRLRIDNMVYYLHARVKNIAYTVYARIDL